LALQPAQSSRLSRAFFTNGAAEGKNLEQPQSVSVLEELENWTKIIQAEPEVVRVLGSFSEAAGDDDFIADLQTVAEPSP